MLNKLITRLIDIVPLFILVSFFLGFLAVDEITSAAIIFALIIYFLKVSFFVVGFHLFEIFSDGPYFDIGFLTFYTSPGQGSARSLLSFRNTPYAVYFSILYFVFSIEKRGANG